MELNIEENPIATNIILIGLIWTIVIPILLLVVFRLSSAFCTWPIPLSRAYLPSRLPHPNPPERSIPFDIPLARATREQIDSFMTYRGFDTKNCKDIDLQVVAAEAAKYKGQLFEARLLTFLNGYYVLKKKSMRFPLVPPHWNGWNSFWLETSPLIRRIIVSAAVLLISEHVISGIVFPLLYLQTHKNIYFLLTMYSEIGVLVFCLLCTLASYITGRNFTLEQGPRSTWHLIVMHHVSVLLLCTLAVYLDDRCPKEYACGLMLAHLGCSSGLHELAVVLDFSPSSSTNKPMLRFVYQVICAIVQIFLRCVHWVRDMYVLFSILYEQGNNTNTVVLLLGLTLLTLFNWEYTKHHVKLAKSQWKNMKKQA